MGTNQRLKGQRDYNDLSRVRRGIPFVAFFSSAFFTIAGEFLRKGVVLCFGSLVVMGAKSESRPITCGRKPEQNGNNPFNINLSINDEKDFRTSVQSLIVSSYVP